MYMTETGSYCQNALVIHYNAAFQLKGFFIPIRVYIF